MNRLIKGFTGVVALVKAEATLEEMVQVEVKKKKEKESKLDQAGDLGEVEKTKKDEEQKMLLS